MAAKTLFHREKVSVSDDYGTPWSRFPKFSVSAHFPGVVASVTKHSLMIIMMIERSGCYLRAISSSSRGLSPNIAWICLLCCDQPLMTFCRSPNFHRSHMHICLFAIILTKIGCQVGTFQKNQVKYNSKGIEFLESDFFELRRVKTYFRGSPFQLEQLWYNTFLSSFHDSDRIV